MQLAIASRKSLATIGIKFKLSPRFGIYIYMQKALVILVGLLCLSTLNGDAAHTRATLILSATTARPGETITAGVHLQMDTGWHTYWKNSGESGAPTKIKWQLPPGVAAGDIQWPLPEKYESSDLTTYVYHNEVVLFVPLTLAHDLKPGSLELSAKIEWLECMEVCLKASTNVAAQLQIGNANDPSPHASKLEAWKKKLPQPAKDFTPQATWEKPTGEDTRPFILEWTPGASATEPDFLPYVAESFEVQGGVENLSKPNEPIRIRKVVKKYEGAWPDKISGVLIQTSNGERQGFSSELKLTESKQSSGAALPERSNPVIPGKESFFWMLLSAFVGGLILNIMPCVFPVIGLKILGFVNQSHEQPRRVFRLGLIYGLGVLASFLVMAGILIGIQKAGGSIGWGMQFKNPQISVGMIVLVLLIALNLFGVFEVNLCGGSVAAAGNLASREGPAGAFFNGILATVLATPCTAPILAGALGFAFSKPPLVLTLFFLTIGLGLAFPYVLLSWKPAWLKFLPRPSRWMERFKMAMGFPMLGTALWIFWFTAPRFGEGGVLWLGFFLITIALALWVWGEFIQRGSKGRALAAIICLVLLGAGYGLALEQKLHWRSPGKTSDLVQWKPWSHAAVQKARSEGRPILVDFTAKWCVTCNALVKPAVDNREVRKKLDEIKGVALLADYTDYPDEMTAELKKFHSDAAVPLVLVYPRDASQPPEVLPTIPRRADVLAALDRAAR